MTGPRQLLLDLPQRPALGRDDFLVAPSNEAAVALVDAWPQWPSYGAILQGPEGAGKSHLAHVWQARAEARLVEAAELRVQALDALVAQGPLGIENLQPGLFDERALFHALNLVRQAQGSVLITTRFDLAGLKIALPDLASRLKALPLVGLLAPDDALLRGVLAKLFHDRQVAVDEAILNFILLRMPRSLAAARALVAAIDHAAMTEKAEVTRAFVSRIMAQQAAPDFFTTP